MLSNKIKLVWLLLLVSYWPSAHSQSIDFANFTYALPDCQDYGIVEPVYVTNGEAVDQQQGTIVWVDTDKILYADTTGDDAQEAVVTVHCGWYGANYTTPSIQIFSLTNGQAILIGQLSEYLFSEEYRRYYPDSHLWPELTVSFSNGTIIINKGADGAHCCPDYQVKFYYGWNPGGLLVSLGEPQRQKADASADSGNFTPPPPPPPPSVTPPSQEPNGFFYYYEAMETANIRERPGTDSAKVGVLSPRNLVFAENSEHPDWYKVYLTDGNVAYVYKPLLRRADEFGQFPLGAWGASSALQGTFSLSGSGFDTVGDTRLMLELTGEAARVLYHILRAAPQFDDPCSGWSKTKTVGAIRCGTNDEQNFGCDFAIDHQNQTLSHSGGC